MAILVASGSFADGQDAKPASANGNFDKGRDADLTPGRPARLHQGSVTGRETATFTFSGRRGQTLSVLLKSSSPSLYFNVLPSDSPEAIYASDREALGNSGSVMLPADGDYEVQVYLFRNAARRGAKASFSLSLSLK